MSLISVSHSTSSSCTSANSTTSCVSSDSFVASAVLQLFQLLHSLFNMLSSCSWTVFCLFPPSSSTSRFRVLDLPDVHHLPSCLVFHLIGPFALSGSACSRCDATGTLYCCCWRIRLSFFWARLAIKASAPAKPDLTLTDKFHKIRKSSNNDSLETNENSPNFVTLLPFSQKYRTATSWASGLPDRSLLITILYQPHHHIYTLCRKPCRTRVIVTS